MVDSSRAWLKAIAQAQDEAKLAEKPVSWERIRQLFLSYIQP